jgi:hypothetical protein
LTHRAAQACWFSKTGNLVKSRLCAATAAAKGTV